MSYSKMKMMEEMENGYSSYYDYHYNDQENEEYEEYVDICFDGYDRVYTYISPKNFKIKTNDVLYIYGNDGVEKIRIIKGTYLSPKKYGMKYKVLPLVEQCKEQNVENTFQTYCIIEEYKRSKHFKLWNKTLSFVGGYHKSHLEKYDEESPSNTYVLFDKNNSNRYIGSFCIVNENNYYSLAISLAYDYFSPDTILIDCYKALSKYILQIYQFIKCQYKNDIHKFYVELEKAGPYGYENDMLGILNESNVMHVGFKYKLDYWKYVFNNDK